MRQKGQGYKKTCTVGVEQPFTRMSVDVSYDPVSPARYPNPGRKRKSTQSAPPAGKKKKEKAIQHMTPMDASSEDCDPVVREVVEDTRAAVEEMMKELNDMVDQATQTRPPPQFTVTNVYDNEEAWAKAQGLTPPSSVDSMVCPCHDVRLEDPSISKRMALCQMSHPTVFAVLWPRPSPGLYESRVWSTSARSVGHVELFPVLLP